MNFIKLTLVNGDKALINLDKVAVINHNQMSKFYNVERTVLSFRGEDDYTEVLETLEEIEQMINGDIKANTATLKNIETLVNANRTLNTILAYDDRIYTQNLISHVIDNLRGQLKEE